MLVPLDQQVAPLNYQAMKNDAITGAKLGTSLFLSGITSVYFNTAVESILGRKNIVEGFNHKGLVMLMSVVAAGQFGTKSSAKKLTLVSLLQLLGIAAVISATDPKANVVEPLAITAIGTAAVGASFGVSNVIAGVSNRYFKE